MSWFGARRVLTRSATTLLAREFEDELSSEPIVLHGAFPAALGCGPYCVLHLIRGLIQEAGHTLCLPQADCGAPEATLAEVFEGIAQLPGGVFYENHDALDASALATAAFSGLPYAGPRDGLAGGKARALLLLATRGGATPIRRFARCSAWLLLADGTAAVYLVAPGGERWEASLGATDTLMVPEGWAFQASFSAERALAVLSPYMARWRLPPNDAAAVAPASRPLPVEMSYRAGLPPIHLQARHAFLEAYRTAVARCGRGRLVVRAISIRSASNAARREMMHLELLEPLRRELGADAVFFDAVNGRALELKAEPMGDGGKQRCCYHTLPDGTELWADVDASFWVGLCNEEQRQAHLRKHASMFRAELDRAAFHHGLYEPAVPSLGMVGNHLSHAALWHELLAEGVEWALLVEDDATPAPHMVTGGWTEIARAVVAEVATLRSKGEPWDVLFVGRTLSGTPEGCDVTPLTVEVGWTLRTHCYAVSRRGMRRLVDCGLASHVFHCAMDEILAAMAAGDHWHEAFAARLRELGCLDPNPLRILGFRYEGVVFQLMDVESTERSLSQCVGEGAERI
eukprot:NODE_3031_length_2104_cov_13.512393.p1 GENE.NODE_3031_length_2104_cov_13.512393~~NODE_3031_length_2104_cov_13.512393.p1  ORF type:complete len:620 (-),score=187.24 NODE_3031_length_2104_cov_13.512393:244-1962(-)